MAMMPSSTAALLDQFARNRSEDAFRSLVRRHSGLVYHSALRILRGDRAAAQDVTQEVFALLARKAPSLGGGILLEGWLHRQACRRAINHLRGETRRRKRERLAVEHLAPSPAARSELANELDQALLALPARDRDGLILRYFEGMDYRAVGGALGIAEDAARKRVARALEKLSHILQRRGVAIPAASLGGGMQAMGGQAAPPALADGIPLPPATPGSSLLVPILAGAGLTSALAASAMVAGFAGAPPHDPPPPPSTSLPAREAPRPSTAATTAPPDLIAEIQRIHAGPAHALTSLKLDALLDSIPLADIPEIVREGNERLSPAERDRVYTRLFERWLAADPHAALDFAVAENVGSHLDPHTGTHFLGNLFDRLVDLNPAASADWLLANWEHEALREHAFLGELRMHLAMHSACERLRLTGVDEAFAFIDRLPGGEARREITRKLLVNEPYSSSWLNLSAGRRLELYRKVSRLPDAAVAREFGRTLLRHWTIDFPDQLESVSGSLSPEEKYEMALGRLGAGRKAASETPTLGGGRITHFEETNDLPDRQAATVAAGLALGYSLSDILRDAGEVVIAHLPDDQALKWLDEHRGEAAFDAALARKMRERIRVFGTGIVIAHPVEVSGLDWISRISDPELRARMSRAAFMRLVQTSMSTAAVREYLGQADLPADLAADFSKLLSEAP